MTTTRSPDQTWLAWLLAHALAFGLAAAIVEAIHPVPTGWDLDAATLWNRATIALAGVFTSLAQGWLLRRRFRAWWAATLVGTALGAGLALGVEWLLPDLPAGSDFGWGVLAFIPVLWLAMLGLGQGLAQLLLLRAPARPAWRWAGGNAWRWFASLPGGHVSFLLFTLVLVMLTSLLPVAGLRGPGFEAQRALMMLVTPPLLSAAIGAVLGLLTYRALQVA